MKKRTKKTHGEWIDDIFNAVGHYIHMETMDGIVREGRLSGIRMREIYVNGEMVDYPDGLELNGDCNEYVEIVLLRRITID